MLSCVGQIEMTTTEGTMRNKSLDTGGTLMSEETERLRRVGTQTRFPTLRCGNGFYVPVTHRNGRFGVLLYVSRSRGAPSGSLSYDVWRLDDGTSELWGDERFWDVPSFVRAVRLALDRCRRAAGAPVARRHARRSPSIDPT